MPLTADVYVFIQSAFIDKYKWPISISNDILRTLSSC